MNTLFMNCNALCLRGLSFSRPFSTSVILSGKKTRVPYDRRRPYPPTGKDINPSVKGGNADYPEIFGTHGYKFGRAPHPTGYKDKKTGQYKMVKEMIPEFVVPDLKGFELKPYVSYKTKDIYQSEFTAKSLFDATYGKDIQEDFDEQRGTVDEIMKRTLAKYK